MPSPIDSVTVTRPWQWGIAVLSDRQHGGDIPDVDPGAPVSANAFGLVILVRHAQDAGSLDDGYAEASVTLTQWIDGAMADRPGTVLFDGVIETPTGRMIIGDAEFEAEVPCPRPSSRIRVTSDEHEHGAEHAWVDMVGS